MYEEAPAAYASATSLVSADEERTTTARVPKRGWARIWRSTSMPLIRGSFKSSRITAGVGSPRPQPSI
jgi:hypothetical protein